MLEESSLFIQLNEHLLFLTQDDLIDIDDLGELGLRDQKFTGVCIGHNCTVSFITDGEFGRNIRSNYDGRIIPNMNIIPNSHVDHWGYFNEQNILHRLEGPAIHFMEWVGCPAIYAWVVEGNVVSEDWLVDNVEDPHETTKEEQILMKITFDKG